MSKTAGHPRRSRIAHFKAPFILSVAAPAALALGCGGKTDGLDQTLEGAYPVPGQPCDERATQSTGDAYHCPPPECINGRWEIATCNPPPILPSTCPGPMPPPPNSDCYGTASCVDGQWEYPLIACNPPPPPSLECPAEAPVAGDSCAGHGAQQTCNYAYCGGSFPMFTCNNDGAWEALPLPTCNPPPLQLDCPAEPPIAGESCEFNFGQTCEYEFCGGRVPMFTCNDQAIWEALPLLSCNPPPPPCFFDDTCGLGSADAGLAPDAGAAIDGD